MRNSASSGIGGPPGRIAPIARASPTLPWRATIRLAPGARPAAISRARMAAKRSSPGVERPMLSGSATGRPAKSSVISVPLAGAEIGDRRSGLEARSAQHHDDALARADAPGGGERVERRRGGGRGRLDEQADGRQPPERRDDVRL